MKTSQAGIDLIKRFESCRLATYDDATGKTVNLGDLVEGVLTIGWGHTGPQASPGNVITQDQADGILSQDLDKFEDCLNSLLIKVRPTQDQFDALIDFVFNLGCESLAGSTLLLKLNKGDMPGAADEFGRWVYFKGRILSGLVRRRNVERCLFLGVVTAT